MGTSDPMREKPPRIFISAGEQSGDRIGASLLRAFRRIAPDATFTGIGGEAMRAEGLEIVRDLAGHDAMWFLRSLTLIPRMYRVLRDCRRVLDDERPDAVVVIDYPGFHFYLCREAKRRGIPSIYYVTPQLWAYNPYRAVKMRKWVDRALVVLPFEEAFFDERGIAAEYVGHPLMDDLRGEWGDDPPPAHGADEPVLGILPGSRRQEVEANLAPMMRAAARVREREPALKLLASASRPPMRPLIEEAAGKVGLSPRILDGRTGEVLRGSTLSLVTSGTITLEGVFHEGPMIVLYRIPAISYWASRPWRLIPHIALPNILAGREIVPEFVLTRDGDERFIEAVLRRFGDDEGREAIRSGLREVRRVLLERRDASLSAARGVLEAVREKRVCQGGGTC